jgi:hypothetical protein
LYVIINEQKKTIMKKYFGIKQIFTLDELKTIVANNAQLAFTFGDDEIISEITGRIYIHNHNGKYMGHSTAEFRPQEDGNWNWYC